MERDENRRSYSRASFAGDTQRAYRAPEGGERKSYSRASYAGQPGTHSGRMSGRYTEEELRAYEERKASSGQSPKKKTAADTKKRKPVKKKRPAPKPAPKPQKPKKPKKKLTKAQLRKRRALRKRLLHLAVILLLILALVFVIMQTIKKTKEAKAALPPEPVKLTEADFEFHLPENLKQVGEMQILEEIADFEGYRVRYPAVGHVLVDGEIKSRAEDIASIFKSEVSSCRQDGQDRMIMTADYAFTKLGNEYVSVLFDVHKQLRQESLSGERIESYTYSMISGEAVALPDMLTGNYKEFLRSKLEEYAESLGGEIRNSNIQAEDKCFRNYTFSDEGLTLYYLKDTLIEDGKGLVSFTIPLEEIAEYLAVPISTPGV